MNGIALWKLQPVEIPQKHPESQCIQYTMQAVLNSLINCMAANQLYAIQVITCKSSSNASNKSSIGKLTSKSSFLHDP
jgi:hypothetical protein